MQVPTKPLPLVRIVVPFILITLLMLSNQVVGTITTLSYTLNQIGTQNSKLLAIEIAAILLPDVQLGKITDNSKARIASLTADSSVLYVKAIDASGGLFDLNQAKGANAKAGSVKPDELKREQAAAQNFAQNATDDPSVYEQLAPIRDGEKEVGVVRLGVSRKNTDAAIRRVIVTTIIGALLTLIIGNSVYAITVMRTMENWLAGDRKEN